MTSPQTTIDDLLREAVWAMKHVRETERIFTESRSADALRAQAFLSRPEVRAFIEKEARRT